MDAPVSVLLYWRSRLYRSRERHDVAPAKTRMYVHTYPPNRMPTEQTCQPKDIASPQDTRALHLTLLTLLFSYAYDARTTQHDPTPESAWTIAVLTPAFSALDPPPYPTLVEDDPRLSSDINIRELAASLIPSYRRTLAFPLYRSWALAEVCRMDSARLLARGTRTVLRCLLELRTILDTHEVYYVYSRIWLDDFCRWIQACARYGQVNFQNYLLIYFFL